MTVLLMLQSDLRSLSVESRSKHPQVKEAAERAILQVRSLKQPEPGSEEGPAAASVGQFELVVRPLTMACKTREPKLALIAVGCLQKLIAQDAIPLESLSAVLATLVDQADTGDEGVQAKILQTVLSLLASRTYPVRRDDLSRAFSICLVLHDQSAASALINNTATATMRQAVSLLFERVVASGGGAGAAAAAAAVAGGPPIGETDTALSCAFLLVRDLCCLANGQATRWLQVKALDLAFVLELLESLVSSHTSVFAGHDAMVAVLRDEICQLVARVLGGGPPFDMLHRAMRLALSIVTHFTEALPQECATFVRQCVSSLLPRHAPGVRAGEPTRWENEAPLWKRTLAMEMLCLLCADRALSLRLLTHTRMWPEVLSSLVLAIEYGLNRDKVFPSLAGSQRRVSLQLPGDTAQPNASAGHALSLGIGAMIHLVNGFTLAEPTADPIPGDAVARQELALNSWKPVLQMAALVMERCNAQEMVEAVMKVYISFSGTAASLRMADAQSAIISSLAKLTAAQGVPLSQKDVAVCNATFRCINALRQELDAASWLRVVSFLEQMDNILGDPKEPVGDGRVEKEHRMQLLATFSEFYACTATLSDDAFERMATAMDAVLCKRLAGRDVQYREAPLSLPRSFTIVCWPRMFGGDTYRFRTAYAPIVAHLRKAAVHKNTLVSRLGVDALFRVITQILQHPAHDEKGNAIETDQQGVLQPLSELTEAGSDECQTHVLDGMYTLLESSGYELSHGWSLILSVIQGCAGSDTAKVVSSAFRCVQLIVNDFLSSMPVEHCQLCVVTVGRFRAHLSDMNMNLTAIGQLWNIADFFGREQDILVDTLDKVALGSAETPAINPTPYPVAQSTQLDARAMTTGTDGGGNSFECPDIKSAVTSNGAALESAHPHMDRLWRTLFAEMQLSCEDARPEVRKCALRTLMSTVTSHGDLFSAFLWHELLWNTLFPVLASVHGAALTADESKEGNDTVDATLGSGKRQTAPMMMHHSRNTVSKQWDETRALALNGASRVFCRFFPAFQQLDCISIAWKLLLEFAEASLRHKSAEVVTGGVEAVTELLSDCFSATDRAPVASSSGVDVMQTLWRDAVAMLGAVTVHITANLGAVTVASHRQQWIRMPTSPGLSERSLQLFATCICTVYSKVWSAAWVCGADVEHLAVAIDRLVHYSLRFEQTVSYIVVAGKEQSVMALSPTQERALAWMRLVLEQASDAADGQPQHSESISPLLLLHCLRYLPGGAAAVSGGGGHSLLHNSVELESAETSFALAKAALQLLLDFFGLGVHEAESIDYFQQQQDLFVLTVKSLVRASTVSLESTAEKDWSAFQMASIRGLLATVRSGIAAHTVSSSGSQLDVVCGELALVAKAYLCTGVAGGEREPARDTDHRPIGIEVASCVTETLLSAVVQTGLSKAVQRQLLEMLDAGIALPESRSTTGDAAAGAESGHTLIGWVPPPQQQALSAACLQSMFRVCQGQGQDGQDQAGGSAAKAAASAVTVATALPFLFGRCEQILHRYVDEARRGGGGSHGGSGGMPVPRWQQDELERLVDLLCSYHLATESRASSSSSSSSGIARGEAEPDGSRQERERGSKRVGLVARLLPAMCAVSALGPGMLNRKTGAGLSRAVHLGFVSLGLEAPFVTAAGGSMGSDGGGGGGAAT